MAELSLLLSEARTAIHAASDLPALEQIKAQYLGKNGLLTSELKNLGRLPPEERPAAGARVNQIKEAIQTALNERLQILQDLLLERALEAAKIDVSLSGRGLPRGHCHPVSRGRSRIEALFSLLGFEVVEGPEIESDYYNFEALNIPADHPARAMQDTFYFYDDKVLRTHTSPVQIRAMQTRKPPVRLIAPGRVYRCDSDVTHTPMFHQVEGLCISEHANFAELKGILKDFFERYFEKELQLRFRPSYFPFTEPSAEVDISCVLCAGKGCRVCKNTGWLEVMGCGMVHPNVLQAMGLSADQFQGWAFGLGIDRLVMLRYGIPDLRLLFENDFRLLQAF